jgi:hypothetical protein
LNERPLGGAGLTLDARINTDSSWPTQNKTWPIDESQWNYFSFFLFQNFRFCLFVCFVLFFLSFGLDEKLTASVESGRTKFCVHISSRFRAGAVAERRRSSREPFFYTAQVAPSIIITSDRFLGRFVFFCSSSAGCHPFRAGKSRSREISFFLFFLSCLPLSTLLPRLNPK